MIRNRRQRDPEAPTQQTGWCGGVSFLFNQKTEQQVFSLSHEMIFFALNREYFHRWTGICCGYEQRRTKFNVQCPIYELVMKFSQRPFDLPLGIKEGGKLTFTLRDSKSIHRSINHLAVGSIRILIMFTPHTNCCRIGLSLLSSAQMNCSKGENVPESDSSGLNRASCEDA